MSSIENRVRIIPIEQPFLRVLASYVGNEFKAFLPDLSDILIVFPSQRNKFYFRRYLLDAVQAKGIIPPAMKTVEELIEHVYESSGGKRARLLNNVERNFILKKVIDELKVEFWNDLPFLRFVAVGNRLLNFFDELTKERITLDDLEKAVGLGHFPEKYINNELPILKKIHKEYRTAIRGSGHQDNGDKNDLVYERFSVQCLSKYECVLIAGLAATTTVEVKMIKELLAGARSELVLHSCKPEDLEGMNQADRPFYVHHKLLHTLGVDMSKITTLSGETPVESVVHVKEIKTESEQTLYLQSVLKECIGRYGELHRIGIVLPDESIMSPVTESLRVAGIGYNLSAGLPLAQSALYSFLGQMLEVIRNGFHYEEFFIFIRHPLFKNAVINGQSLRPLIYGLEHFMIKNRLNFFQHDTVTENRFDPLLDILQKGFSAAQSDRELEDYIEGMVSYLNELLGYNKQLLETNAPDINGFFEQLHRLTGLRMTEKLATRGIDSLEFILWALKDHTYRVEGDPMRGIQVIGLLEARNLDFDCLILPSMNEGVFPRRSEKDMFVNQQVRRDVGLPYTQERENLYYYYFTELIKGKKEVYLSYVAEEERDVASRFINLTLSGARRDESTIKLARIAFDVHKRAVRKSPQIVKALYQYVQKDGLSPTALSDYRKCPYRYYLKFVLRISEPDEIVEEPGPKEWGEVVHNALKNFYQYHFPRGFTEKEMDRAVSVIERELENALKRNRSLAFKPKASAYLDLNVYRRRMRHFLETEIERFHGGFKIFKAVLEREAKHHLSINGAQVRVYGYIDRIDLLSDQYYIIDYKTGRIPGRKNYEISEDFSEFQLPLYALVFSKEHFDMIGGMMYYEIGKQARTVNIIEGKDAAKYLDAFKREILVPTIQEILDPDIVFYQAENDDFCEYCIYRELCGDEHGREDK